MDLPLGNIDYNRFYKLLGQRLRRLREQRGLKQSEMAKLIKVSYRHYQDVEGGKINLRGETLLRCLLAVDFDLYEIREECLLLTPDRRMPLRDPTTSPCGFQTTILIIDDEPSALKLLPEMLSGEEHRWKILTAISLKEALLVVQRERIDIAIVDVALPLITGFEVMNQLKQMGTLCSFIVMSGDVSLQNYRKALESGAIEFLEKPFDESDLKRAIMRAESYQKIERERSELFERHRQSEIKYRKMVDTSLDAIILSDALTGNILDCNEICEKIYGWTRDELSAMNRVELTVTKGVVAEDLDLIRSKEGHYRIPLRYHQKKSGKPIPVEISASLFPYNGREVICEMIRDISERLAMEEELRFSEARFRTLIEYAPVALSIADRQGRCIYVNRAWSLLNGLDLDRAKGDGWLDTVCADDREFVYSNWYGMVERQEGRPLRYRLQSKCGKIIWVHAITKEVVDTFGNHWGYMNTTFELSKLVEMAKQI